MARADSDLGIINPPRTPLLTSNGRLSEDWFRWLSLLQSQTNQIDLRLRLIEGGGPVDPGPDPVDKEDVAEQVEVALAEHGQDLAEIAFTAQESTDAPEIVSEITADPLPADDTDALTGRVDALEHDVGVLQQPALPQEPDAPMPYIQTLDRRIYILEARVHDLDMSLRQYQEAMGIAVAHTNSIIDHLLRNGKRYVWRDELGAATGLNPAGASTPPDPGSDGTWLFSNTSTEDLPIIYQVNHDWAGGVVTEHGDSGLEGHLHLHWHKTTDAAGDVEWEYRYTVQSNDAVFPAFSSWTAATTRGGTLSSDQRLLIDGFPAIDLTGQEISCIVKTGIRRNTGAGDDTYGADAALASVDMHILADTFKPGSDLEFVKFNWFS